MSDRLQRAMLQQDSKFASYAQSVYNKMQSEGGSGYSGYYHAMKNFLDGPWSVVMNHLTASPPTDRDNTPISEDQAFQALREEAYYQARKAGFPESTILYDIQIDTKTSGETMSAPPSFRACCQLTLGPNHTLCVEGCWGDQPFYREFDLSSALNALSKFHRQLHGDVAVSGWLDDVGDAFSSVASDAYDVLSDKAVEQTWKEISPVVSNVIPGGKIIDIAFKAHDAIVNAKKGDPKAKAVIANVKAQAVAGNPNAQSLLDVMQTLNNALNLKNAKATLVSGNRIPWTNPWLTKKPTPHKVPVNQGYEDNNFVQDPTGAMVRPRANQYQGYGYDPSQGYQGYGYDPSQGYGYGDPSQGYYDPSQGYPYPSY